MSNEINVSDLSPEEEVQLVREEIFPQCQTENPCRLMGLLQQIQSRLGYLPRPVLKEVADFMGLSHASVWGVATFYNQFRLSPPGRNRIKICLGTACHIKGGEVILESWERELGILEGETTPDREYSLERVACVGCCAMAPVMLVNERVMGKVTPISVKGVLLTRRRTEGGTPDSSLEEET